MHALKIENLTFVYPDGNPVINDLNLIIEKGERIGLIGANGAGKSTLLLLLMGMLPRGMGEIAYGDLSLDPRNLPAIRKKAGFVFQNADDQLFMNSVYEDLAFGPRNYGMEESEVEKLVDQVLDTIGISHLKDRSPSKLSGGEKRLAAIGTALSLGPEILLMDEPSTGLDPKSRRRILNWLKTYAQTLVITSHDLDFIYETCDRVLILNEGRIVANGNPDDILSCESLLAASGLEVPPYLKLCENCGHSRKNREIKGT